MQKRPPSAPESVSLVAKRCFARSRFVSDASIPREFDRRRRSLKNAANDRSRVSARRPNCRVEGREHGRAVGSQKALDWRARTVDIGLVHDECDVIRSVGEREQRKQGEIQLIGRRYDDGKMKETED